MMSDVHEIEVPKTVGDDGKASLKIDIRADEAELGPGLFVYGFMPGSNAGRQGLLKVGDELLIVNDIDVEGGTIPDLVRAMQNEEYVNSTVVPMMVRRQVDQSRHVSTVSTPFVSTPFAPLSAVDENMLSPYSQYNQFNYGEEEDEHVDSDIDADGDFGGDDAASEGIVLEVDVPKTNHNLQLDLRNDVQMFGKGLFLFGFLTKDSLAEQQGNLQPGDEILEVNGINVAGGTREDVEAILREDVFPDVLLKIHRATRSAASLGVIATEKRVFTKNEEMEVPTHVMPSLTNLQPLDYDSDDESAPEQKQEQQKQKKEEWKPTPGPSIRQTYAQVSAKNKGKDTEKDNGKLSVAPLRSAPSPPAHRPTTASSTPVAMLTLPSLRSLQPLNYDSDQTSARLNTTGSVSSTGQQSGMMPPYQDLGSSSLHSLEKRNARLSSSSSAVFEVEVPKTAGSLKMDIRSDENVFGPGLFVLGLAPGSNVERQGVLQVGDELLAVNGRGVDGGTLEDLAKILRQEVRANVSTVRLKVRRMMDTEPPFYPLERSYMSLGGGSQSGIFSGEEQDVDEPTPSLYDKKNRSTGPDSHMRTPNGQQSGMMLPYEDIGSSSLHSLEKRNARLAASACSMFEVIVPKTEEKLKIDIRSDENIFGPGLFVLGFAPGSNVERQGALRVGDELLAVNGKSIDGGTLEDLGRLLSRVDSPRAKAVRLQIRRMNDFRPGTDGSQSQTQSQMSFASHFSQDEDSKPMKIETSKPTTTSMICPVAKAETSPAPTLEQILAQAVASKQDVGSQEHSAPAIVEPPPVLSLTEFMKAREKAEKEAAAQNQTKTEEPASSPSKEVHISLTDTAKTGVLNDADQMKIKRERTGGHEISEPPEFMKIETNKNVNEKWVVDNAARNATEDTGADKAKVKGMETDDSDKDAHAGNEESELSNNPDKVSPPLSTLTIQSEQQRKKSKTPDPMHGPDLGSASTHTIEHRSARQTTMTCAVFEVEVPKTDGKLKIDIRSDENIFGPGLFVFGFAPGSNVERQGMLRVGDELLAVNGRGVDGGSMAVLSRLLRQDRFPDSPIVRLKLRRMSNAQHVVELSQISYSSIPEDIDTEIGIGMGSSVLDQDNEDSTIPGTTFEVDVPKTGGKLRIDIRDDEKQFGPGLFVFGFAPGSNAERQGMLRVGDELLAVNGVDVFGGSMDNLSGVMENEADSNAPMMRLTLKRRPLASFNLEKFVAPSPQLQHQHHTHSVPDTHQGVMEVTPYSHTNHPTSHVALTSVHSAPPITSQFQYEYEYETHPSSRHEARYKQHQEQRHFANQRKNSADDAYIFDDENALNTASYVHPITHNASIDSFGNDNFDVLDMDGEEEAEEEEEQKEEEEEEEEVPLPFRDLEVLVPKTGGALRILINEDLEEKGLFVEGFGPDSKAAHQGVLRVGDEFLSVNGVDVAGGLIDDFIYALENGERSSSSKDVLIVVRRYFEEGEDMDDLFGLNSQQQSSIYDDLDAGAIVLTNDEASKCQDMKHESNEQDNGEDNHSYVTKPKDMKDHFSQQEIFQAESIITSLQSQGLLTARSDNTSSQPKSELSAVCDKALLGMNRDISMTGLQILLGDMEQEVKTLLENAHHCDDSVATLDADNKSDLMKVVSMDGLDAEGKGADISVQSFRRQSAYFSIPKFATFFVDNIIKQSLSVTQTNRRMMELEEKRLYLEKMLNSIMALRVKQEMDNKKEKKQLEDQLIEANRTVERLKKLPSSSASPPLSAATQSKINAILEKEKRDKMSAILAKEKQRGGGVSLERLASLSNMDDIEPSPPPQKISLYMNKANRPSITSSSDTHVAPSYSSSSRKSNRKKASIPTISRQGSLDLEALVRRAEEQRIVDNSPSRRASAKSSASNSKSLSKSARGKKKASIPTFARQGSLDLEALVRRAESQRVAGNAPSRKSSAAGNKAANARKKKSIPTFSRTGSLDLEGLVRRADANRAAAKRDSMAPMMTINNTPPSQISSSDRSKKKSNPRLDLKDLAQQGFQKTEQASSRARTASGDSVGRRKVSGTSGRSSNTSQHFDGIGNLLSRTAAASSSSNSNTPRQQVLSARSQARSESPNQNQPGDGQGLDEWLRKRSYANTNATSNACRGHFDNLGNWLSPSQSDGQSYSHQSQRHKHGVAAPSPPVDTPPRLSMGGFRVGGRPSSVSGQHFDGLGTMTDSHTSTHVPVEQPQAKSFKGKTAAANNIVETITYANGDTYEGTLKNGKRHGRGTFTWANGDVYVGAYVEDEKFGQGRLTYSNGDVFDGYRVHDKKNGKGKYVFVNGCVYDGNYVDDCFQGMGTFSSYEGWCYEGEWFQNAAQGHGRLTYANGDVYTGSFLDDMRHGKGCLVCADGSKYEGAFEEDEKCGEGKYFHADGRVEEGTFKGDVFVGAPTHDNTTGTLQPHPTQGNETAKKKKKKTPLMKCKRQVVKTMAPPLKPVTLVDIRRQVATSFAGKVVRQCVGDKALAVFNVARACVSDCTQTAIEKVAPTPALVVYMDVDEEDEEVEDEDDASQEVSANRAEDVTIDVGTSEEVVTENMKTDPDSQKAKECYDESSEPPPPSASTRLVKLNRPMRGAPPPHFNPWTPLPTAPAPESQDEDDTGIDTAAATGAGTDTEESTQINTLLSLLLKNGDLPKDGQYRLDAADDYDALRQLTLTEEQRVAQFFPKKGKTRYEDIKLGEAITKLLDGSDESKLQKYLKPDNEYLPANDSTIALIQRIRRELNLPGNKGIDPKSESIHSELEKELVDEDIAYIDEMALDYNSFIMENKEATASATWGGSGVEVPRLGSNVFRHTGLGTGVGSSVFKNIADESSMLKNDPYAHSSILQTAVANAGIPTPMKNEWMEIFDYSPATVSAAQRRAAEKQRREAAINQKSPYYQSAQSVKKNKKMLSVSKSSDSFIKVGNPCSAINMRSRKLLASDSLPTGPFSAMVPCRSDGTPTCQSTMKMKAQDASFQTFELLVPKTNNGLQIQFTQSATSKIKKSLVIKAFAPDSNVLKQGILRINDEILEVNSVPVKGKFVDDITGIIAGDTDSFILVLIRRASGKRKPGVATATATEVMETKSEPVTKTKTSDEAMLSETPPNVSSSSKQRKSKQLLEVKV